jgi:hypothetical protein
MLTPSEKEIKFLFAIFGDPTRGYALFMGSNSRSPSNTQPNFSHAVIGKKGQVHLFSEGHVNRGRVLLRIISPVAGWIFSSLFNKHIVIHFKCGSLR